jgi:hypothetical protein
LYELTDLVMVVLVFVYANPGIVGGAESYLIQAFCRVRMNENMQCVREVAAGDA